MPTKNSRLKSNKKQDLFEYLPENSMLKNKCTTMPKSWLWFQKSEQQKGCEEVKELLEIASQPERPLLTSFINSPLGWGFGLLVRQGNSEKLEKAINKVLPDESESSKNNEFSAVVTAVEKIQRTKGR